MNDKAEQETTPRGRRVVKVIAIAALLIATSAAGAGAFYFFMAEGPKADRSDDAKPVEIREPIYLKVGPMTVNIQSNRGDRLLYMSMMVEVGDDETKTFLENNMPAINNRMLILLSQQRAENINAIDGKQLVADKILDALQEPFSDPQPELVIESVFFQEFIVQ